MSDAHRKAQAVYTAARTGCGDRKLTFWFSRAHSEKLDRLAKVHGSRQQALEAVLEEAKVPWKRD